MGRPKIKFTAEELKVQITAVKEAVKLAEMEEKNLNTTLATATKSHESVVKAKQKDYENTIQKLEKDLKSSTSEINKKLKAAIKQSESLKAQLEALGKITPIATVTILPIPAPVVASAQT